MSSPAENILTEWPPELLVHLNETTRACQFDWKAVAESVRDFVSHSLSVAAPVSAAAITPALCRELFAACNTLRIPPKRAEPAEREREADLSSLSLDELIAHVERSERRIERRKEEVFQRVLHSLGGATDTASDQSDEATQAYVERQREKQRLREQQEERAREARERERLEVEREKLRRRFDPDSADAEGENPLSLTHSRTHSNAQDRERHAHHREEKDPSEYSLSEEALSLEQVLGGAEFDLLLSELERELDAQAADKDDNEELSELGAILDFLDQEATIASKKSKNKNKSSSNTVVPSSPPHRSTGSLSAALPPTPVRQDIAAAARDLQSILGLFPPLPPHAYTQREREREEDEERAQAKTSSLSLLSHTTHSSVDSTGSESVTIDAVASLSVSASVTETEREKQPTTTTMTSAVRERNTREPVRERPQTAVRDMSESESESDEDDDAAWRKKRAATKSATASLVSQPRHTTRAAHAGYSARTEKLDGVWGTHTAPTVSQSLSHAILQRQREAEEEILEIARLAAELQQQRNRVSESESESEESEDESEREVFVENEISVKEDEDDDEEEEGTEEAVSCEPEASDEREDTTQKESETVVVAVSEISSHTDTQPKTPAHIPAESASSKSVTLSGSFGSGRGGAKGKTNTLSSSSRSQKSLSVAAVTQTPPGTTQAVTGKETFTASLTQTERDTNKESSADVSVSVSVSTAPADNNQPAEQALAAPTISPEREGESAESAGDSEKETERDIRTILSERLSLTQCGAGAHTALSLLPVRSFSDKHTGTVIACAPSQNTTRDVSLHTVLTISLYTDRLYKRVCGDVSEGESERDSLTHTPHTEVPAMRAIEFVLRSLFAEDWELLGLWQNHAVCSVCEGAVWRVVFSAQSHAAQNTLSSAYWREQWKEISLTQLFSSSSTEKNVLSGLVRDGIASNLLDFIEISDYFNEAEKVKGVLRESSLCLSTHALSPSLTELLSQDEERNESVRSVDPLTEHLVQSVSLRSVACLCVQDYLFTERDALPERLLSELVRDAETRGLRLVGCRLTHVPPSHITQTHTVSHTGHTSHAHNSESGVTLRRTSTEAMVSQSVSLSQSLLPTLTLAFAAHNVPTPSSHITGSSTQLSHTSSSSHNKHTLTHTHAHTNTYANTSSAGDVLRALLGPEDPLLARQTDPQSVRARYGMSRERSIAYTPSYARERQTREVAYWFAPPLSQTKADTTEAMPTQQTEQGDITSPTSENDVIQSPNVLYTLSWPCERVVSFTVTLSRSLSVCVSPTVAVSRTLHTLQQALCECLLSQFLSVAGLCECHTLSQTQLTQIQRALSAARLQTHTVSVAESSEEAQTESACQRLFLSFHTHVSDFALARFWEELTRRITEESRKCGSYSVEVAMYASTVNEAVFLSQALCARAVCPTAVTTGSRLAVFDAQRIVTREDTRSHEDLGLCDVVVLRVSVWEVQHVSLLLGLFPQTCAVHIVGVKTVYVNDTNTKTPSHKPRQDVEIILRGYQLLENVEYCLAQLSAALTGSFVTQQPHARVSSVSVLKGMSALEKVFSEFSPSVLYSELAVQDLADFVPSHTYTLTQQAPPQTLTHMPAPTQTLSQTLSVSDVARALFPPSAFNAVSLLFLPWQPHTHLQNHAPRASHTSPSHDARYMRVLSRTLRRLEREGFLVLCVQSVSLTQSDCLVLTRENALAFSAQPSLSEGHLNDAETSSSSSASVPATVLLLLRNAATLRLKTLCGPVTDTALAAAHYPRSLTALLTDLSLASSTQQRDGVQDVVWPALLPSLTCALTEKLLHRYLPQCVEVCARLQHLPVSVYGGEEQSEHDTSFVTAEEITQVITEQWPTDNTLSQRVSLATAKKSLPHQLRAKKECEADSLLLKTTNIAALVLTRELLRERGLSAVLEALQREGLWITNVATAKLDFHTAKLLLEAAGASSLTLRPRRERLLEGPVLCLGVCGPVHAFVRLKAFTVDAHSPQSLWMLDKKDSNGNVEYGVLASSSSNLARELYCLCFDKVLGEDSPFEIVSL